MYGMRSVPYLQVGDRDLLEGVSWRLMPGDRVGLVGSNGAGKSTLLRCLVRFTVVFHRIEAIKAPGVL